MISIYKNFFQSIGCLCDTWAGGAARLPPLVLAAGQHHHHSASMIIILCLHQFPWWSHPVSYQFLFRILFSHPIIIIGNHHARWGCVGGAKELHWAIGGGHASLRPPTGGTMLWRWSVIHINRGWNVNVSTLQALAPLFVWAELGAGRSGEQRGKFRGPTLDRSREQQRDRGRLWPRNLGPNHARNLGPSPHPRDLGSSPLGSSSPRESGSGAARETEAYPRKNTSTPFIRQSLPPGQLSAG